MMDLAHFGLLLLLGAVALGWVARHFDFPYPIALILGGGALSFAPAISVPPLNPALILFLVLPPILYQAALATSWRDFKANSGTIGLLAIGLVIATTLAVGATLKFLLPDIPWAAAFVFGAIVSPPDAIAATSILSKLNIPRRVVTVLEGESLVNDASGLVLYKFAVAAVLTGTFSLFETATEFAGIAIGGILAGVAVALVFIVIHRHLGDVFIEVLTSLLVPYVAYVVAETLQVSGVLAVVTAGLVRARHAPVIVSAEMRILSRSMGNVLVFLLNTLVFVLMGLQLSGVAARLSGRSVIDLMMAGALLSTVAIAVRFAWIYPALYLPRALGVRLRRRASAPLEAEFFIMSWCGMRGIVSLAAGTPFPYRDLIIFFTFVVIAVTLVLQGLTLPLLIRYLHVGVDWSVEAERKTALDAMSRAAIVAIDALAQTEKAAPELARRISAEFAEKVAASHPGAPMAEHDARLAQRLRHAAINAERQELIRIWREQQISDEVLHQFEEHLDYREAHL